MVKYTCLRCRYSNINKSIFIRHLKRKFICKPILEDVSIEYIYNYYFDNEKTNKKTNKKNSSKKCQHFFNICQHKLKKCQQNVNIFDQKKTKCQHFVNINQEKKKKTEYFCRFCNKSFNTRQSKSRHENNSCKNKEEYNDLKELVKLLNEQLKQKEKEIDNTYKQLDKKDKQIDELIKKAGITTNIQNNIKVLAYKDTDLSHLTKKDFIYCLNRSNMCIPHLIKKIHFDPKKPENHNIYISNIKNDYIMIYDGNKWVIKDRDESIEDLIDNNEDLLEQKLEEWIENGEKYPSIMKKFNRYLEKKESDSILDTIKKEIKLLLFNNRKLIKNI